MKETKSLEFKSEISNTFLKTVSAFANYDGGEIWFGVADDGSIHGLSDPVQACLDIENKINDTIHPQPHYELSVKEAEKTVILKVQAGINTPYTYKSKAYKRNDTATIEVDSLELTRLILQGKNMHYEDLPATTQDLSFTILEERIQKALGISALTQDILKTLNLYTNTCGYTHAAEMMADKNAYPGIDIARFGENINIILNRMTFEHESILLVMEQAVEVYRNFYQYEEIHGMQRKKVEKIPEAAFRETIANALIHRTWDTPAQIRILMFEDRIEVTSPGGLPAGLSKEEYLRGNVSMLRNPVIGNIFYRLHIVEVLGTGILRIKDAYAESKAKPLFEVFENSIKVTLPVCNALKLTEDQQVVYNALSKVKAQSMSEILTLIPFGKTKVTSILNTMIVQNYVEKTGNGRGTKYKLL